MTRISQILLATVCIVVCVSCIGLTSEIQINENGSGRMELSYRVSRLIAHMGTVDEGDKFFPVPITREDFETTVAQIEGLSLRSYDMNEDTEHIFVNAGLSFSNIEALSQLFAVSGKSAITLSDSEGDSIYSHTIYDGDFSEIDSDSQGMIDSFFQDYELAFALTAPRDIKNANFGDVDGRTVHAVFSVPDLVSIQEPLIWRVTW